MVTTAVKAIVCDGCGQAASAEHLAARFRRLEWATRYRPIHVNTLILGDVAPADDAEFVYSDAMPFRGEAAGLLRAAGLETAGKSAEEIHHEFQRAGFFLAHLLDCPVDKAAKNGTDLRELIAKRLPATFTRIRRSIKPKRLVLMGLELDGFVKRFQLEELGCILILDGDRAFGMPERDDRVERLRAAMVATKSTG